MWKILKRNTIILCFTTLYITSIHSQPLESTSKAPLQVNGDKKETLITTSTVSNLPINSSGQTSTQTVKFESTTHPTTVSTFPPLIRELNQRIHFPTEKGTHDTESPITVVINRADISESSSYPSPTRNPNLGISTHRSTNIRTSTHPPLIQEIKSVKPVKRDDLQILPLNAVSSTFDVTIHPPVEVTTIFNERSAHPLPTRNPDLGILIHSGNKTKTSTFPPLLHDIGEPKPVEISTITSTISTHPPLLSEMDPTKVEVVSSSTVIKPTEANIVSSEISTYPSPTRNPNLGISMHHPDKASTTPSMLLLEVSEAAGDNSNSKNTTTEKFNTEKCSFAIVGCCASLVSSHEQCFELLGCPGPFWGKRPCEKDIIYSAMQFVNEFYKEDE